MHVPGLLLLTRSSTVVYWLLNMVILFFVYIDKKGVMLESGIYCQKYHTPFKLYDQKYSVITSIQL